MMQWVMGLERGQVFVEDAGLVSEAAGLGLALLELEREQVGEGTSSRHTNLTKQHRVRRTDSSRIMFALKRCCLRQHHCSALLLGLPHRLGKSRRRIRSIEDLLTLSASASHRRF